MNLNQVTIHTSEVEACIAFYRTLGLELIVDSRPRYVRFVCPGGGSTLSLHEAPSGLVNSAITLYFEMEDLDERVAALKEMGLRFDSGPADQRWLWREAYLKDPIGTNICLYFAGENRVNPPWKINP